MKLLKWTSLMVVLGLVASCYPDIDRDVTDFDIVGTNYDPSKNFDDYTTFFIPDSIIIVFDSTKPSPDYPEDEATVIIDGIRNNLISLGWTEMLPADTVGGNIPDVYIRTLVWTSDVSGVVYYGGYYGGWYGGYYPGYPYYGGGASYYSYTTGTVLIDMIDLVHPDHVNESLDIIWTAGLNGLVTSSGGSSSGLSRIEFSINQAFSQSNYLKKN